MYNFLFNIKRQELRELYHDFDITGDRVSADPGAGPGSLSVQGRGQCPTAYSRDG